MEACTENSLHCHEGPFTGDSDEVPEVEEESWTGRLVRENLRVRGQNGGRDKDGNDDMFWEVVGKATLMKWPRAWLNCVHVLVSWGRSNL